jgi:hypothetical protein
MSDERKAKEETEAQPQSELANEELEKAAGGGSRGRNVLIVNSGEEASGGSEMTGSIEFLAPDHKEVLG